MNIRPVTFLCRLVITGAIAAAAFVFLGGAEARFNDGAQAQFRGALSGRQVFRPQIRFGDRARRGIRLPPRRESAATLRNVRPDRRPPPKRVGTRNPNPPCGTPGARRCPGTTTACRTDRHGRTIRPCNDRPRGGDGPPRIAIPDPGPRGSDPFLRSLGTRVERAPAPRAAAPSPTVARQLLVLLAQSQPTAVEDQIAGAYRLTRLSGSEIPLLGARAQVYRINDGRSTQSVIAALSTDPRVMLAQSNIVYQRQGAAGSDAVRAAQYGFDMIGAPRAHQLATGRGIKIAVIDTGIDGGHPDLKDAIVESFDATGSDDRRPDVHGTAIAGIIRARGLVSGIAPDATLLAARAFISTPNRALPESTSFILLRALDWSVRHGANVLNLSFSGARDAAMERIIAEAARRNVIVVAAAGNGGPKAAPSYPAAYPQVIAVTAHDRMDHLYAHANRGAYITVAAPGVDILVPIVKKGHMFMSGTSMASAYVTGVMALLLERAPQLSPEQAMRILSETAGDLGAPGRDDEFGAGRVDAPAALATLTGEAKEIGARQ